MSANDKQISGTHYKQVAIQPWDYVAANNLGYFEGSAIKYVTRWRSKGGIADLQKAIHFLEKLIELESPKSDPLPSFLGHGVKIEPSSIVGGLRDNDQVAHPSGITSSTPLDWITLNQALKEWHGGTLK